MPEIPSLEVWIFRITNTQQMLQKFKQFCYLLSKNPSNFCKHWKSENNVLTFTAGSEGGTRLVNVVSAVSSGWSSRKFFPRRAFSEKLPPQRIIANKF